MTPAELSLATGARIDRATEFLPIIERGGSLANFIMSWQAGLTVLTPVRINAIYVDQRERRADHVDSDGCVDVGQHREHRDRLDGGCREGADADIRRRHGEVVSVVLTKGSKVK